MKHVRLKDGKDEHDNEEEDVGGQDRYLIDGFLSFFANVISIYKRIKGLGNKSFNQEILANILQQLLTINNMFHKFTKKIHSAFMFNLYMYT